MIDNPKAPRIRKAAALARKKDRLFVGKFLAEGPQAVREALKFAPSAVEVVYATVAGRSRMQDLDRLADAAGVEILLVTDEVLASLTETVQPQGVVAVTRLQNTTLAEIAGESAGVDTSDDSAADGHLIALLHEVRDPGNAGAVLRAADAAGANAVIFTGDAIDPWHPKVVRATTGSVFHLPVSYDNEIMATIETLRAQGYRVIAADVKGADLDPGDPLLAGKTVWVFGNEAHGLPDGVLKACDEVRKLPIFGRAESLNLATAATVCLYTSAFAQVGTLTLENPIKGEIIY